MDIRWLSHAAFEISSGAHRILIDPFLAPDNPAAPVGADEVEPTDILVTHGHRDHAAHVVEVAKRAGARCVAAVEVARWLTAEGVEDVAGAGLGGTIETEWGWVRFVPALHGNSLPDGRPIGPAAGLVIGLDGTVIYHLGDTALFSDLRLVAERTPINVAMVPIGGHFTMDQHDAATAAEWLDADVVIPMHYDTFPAIKADPRLFKSEVESRTSSEVVILKPGETHTV